MIQAGLQNHFNLEMSSACDSGRSSEGTETDLLTPLTSIKEECHEHGVNQHVGCEAVSCQ